MFVMKQKKFSWFATAMMVAAVSFVSCTMDDNPAIEPDEPDEPEIILPEVVDVEFDEGSVIKNGTCQGSLNANFWCHEWRTADAQFDGNANIIADPADPANRCAAVVIRSQEEAQAAGNMIEANGAIAGWDSQFFITFGEDQVLKAKDKIRLTMKVKADVDQVADTQSHGAPGAYMHWYCVGDVKFTTEWTEFDSGWIEVGSNSWGKAQEGMYTIAFNLSRGQHNTVYFDDMRVEIDRNDPFDEGSMVKNGRFEVSKKNENYWCHEWRTAEAQFDGASNIIVDPANENNHCTAVVVRSQEEAQAAGNMIEANGAIAGWDSQFFITFGEANALKAGDKIQLKMKVKADVAQVADTQSHAAPGSYMHWYCIGDVNFTTEWTDYDSGVVEVGEGAWGKAQLGMYTIAFNLAKGSHNTVYFDDIQVFITRAQ